MKTKKFKRIIGAVTAAALSLSAVGFSNQIFKYDNNSTYDITASAASHSITIANAANGSVTASVSGTTVTSADEGATVTLTANPTDGYKLNSVIGTYKGNPQETLRNGGAINDSRQSVSGNLYNLLADNANANGWNLYGKRGDNYQPITITSKYSNNITKVELNIQWQGNNFNSNLSALKSDHGSLSVNGNTITITSINSPSVNITGEVDVGAKGCRVNQAKIYGDGTVETNLTITSTTNANIKTFTMPVVADDNGVTITPTFAPETYDISYKEADGTEITDFETDSSSTVSYTYGTAVAKTALKTPKMDGRVFEGWYKDAGLTSAVEDTAISATDTGAKTFYAKWKKNYTPTAYNTIEQPPLTLHNYYDDYVEVYECDVNAESVKIPSEVEGDSKTVPVTRIGENAFNSCKSLTEVKIPDSITEIGANAFWGCTSLETIIIPKSVTEIGKDIFKRCTSFEAIYGYTGSAAEEYAKINNIKFIPLDAQPEKILGTAKAPTVDEQGTVHWEAVENAVSYKIVKEYDGKTYFGKETTETSYQQNNTRVAQEHRIYIRAFDDEGNYTDGEVLTVPEKANRLGTAKAPTVDNDGVVSWKSVTNASKYVVVKVVDGEKYYGKSTTETSYKFANKPRKDYQVYVLTYDEMGNYTVGQEAEVELPLGYVDDVTVDAKGNVTWTAARNAVKYKVGKTVNGKTYYTGELTTNSATIKVPKSDYKVFVVAFDKEGNKTWGIKVDVKVN